MSNFELHEKLKSDCIVLGSLNGSLLLLMNNSLVPWFIIVPQTDRWEIYQLTDSEQAALYASINQLSGFVAQQFKTDKINMASIGNIVKQMHIHVVGRWYDDYCWPDVVWGRKEKAEYKQSDVTIMVQQLKAELGESFQSSH